MYSTLKLVLLRVRQTVKICTKYNHISHQIYAQIYNPQHSKNVFLSQITIINGSRIEVEKGRHKYYRAVR